ncbi:ABC transporter substrate-binding protein [cf. Phormidesmis sp. LEGE 11477]|uniref:ABC transporter substrate-binding protein n=1 Tax=cf. Phormidesmis sp. LEGE 11477 TaxID=1828680 RepID=UPI00188202B0|nr:ABC transporter substrate-binding protein [cf. Phormidesmis sp. LEGE 11477]MBE9064772.1 ABC transporter substrate-binding protein [cf. Phormidesmis sp. LEGE 11477]
MQTNKSLRSQQRLFIGIFASLLTTTFACSPPPETTANADASQPDSSSAPSETGEATALENEPAERIVALTSLSADLVATLDVNRLVGIPGSPIITQDSRFADIETVSSGRVEPDLEKIVALSPDLVIGAKGLQDKTLQRLSDLDISTLTIDIDSWEKLSDFTTAIAATTEADPQPLLDRYADCLADVPQKETTSLVLVSRQPLLSPNKDSWAGDFLAKMNIQNLSADLQGESPFDGYVTLSAEKVIEADPDSLIIIDTQEDLLSQLEGEPFWSQLQATQSGNVVTSDYFGLVNPGSLASIETACDQLKQID